MSTRASTRSKTEGHASSKAIRNIKDLFRKFDSDGSGTISRMELSTLLFRMGNFTYAEIDRIMDVVDTNGNGLIEYEEFLDWLTDPTASSLPIPIEKDDVMPFDLEAVLQPLWKIYDRDDSNSITRAEFQECYGILQGALSAIPAEEGAIPVAALVQSNEEGIFKLADTDHNDQISFAEFVEWQREALHHSGLPYDELVQLVSKLASLVGGIFQLSSATKRSDPDKVLEDPVLRKILPNIASCSRELWRRNSRNTSTPKCEAVTVEFPALPKGIDTRGLVATHLKEAIVTVGVKSIEVRVQAIFPDLKRVGQEGNTSTVRWLAKVKRVTSFLSASTTVALFYYAFQDEQWDTFTAESEVYASMDLLTPQMRLYTLLLAEANFHDRLSWEQIQVVLSDSRQMHVITAEEHMEYNVGIEKAVLYELELATAAEYVEQVSQERRQEQLQILLSQMKCKPAEVMQAFTSFGIFAGHKIWAS